jgi:glutathionyl-hydroquinone reductase
MNSSVRSKRDNTGSADGRFIRQASVFRHWITPDGSAGPTGEDGFPAEPGRYHLYISPACPWAHRTLIFRKLKGLEDLITLSAVGSFMGPKGWSFAPEEGVIPDMVNGAAFLSEVYLKADPGYAGRFTVPVLWDRERRTIVNNESSEIIRMFNTSFDNAGANDRDFYPERLRSVNDEFNDFIYPNINDGVYRAGFATSQEAYEEAALNLFTTLERLEIHLATHRYLAGDTVTEADWRLFTTLVRFDCVYYSHFKCNRKRLIDYPNLWGYTRDLYQIPGVAETVSIPLIKKHYYADQLTINPTGIVPIGPNIDFSTPHGREQPGVGPH